MKTANRAKWTKISIALAIVLAATVGVVRAAERPRESQPKVERIVPLATPVELNPCAVGACF